MVGGEPREVDARLAARFEVVRGILVGALTMRQGAWRLRMELEALHALVEGARQRVLAALAIPRQIDDITARYAHSQPYVAG
jgi:hypothetical protein